MEVGRVAFRCKPYPWEIYCTMAGKTNIDRYQKVLFLTLLRLSAAIARVAVEGCLDEDGTV